MQSITKKLLQIVAPALILILAGCGGGESSESGLLPSDSGNKLQPDVSTKTYSAVVEWDIPSTRENGEDLLLSEIGGYEILYRKEGEALQPAIVITDQTRDTYQLEGLAAGRYEVRVAAFDTDNLYSDYSEPAYTDIGQ